MSWCGTWLFMRLKHSTEGRRTEQSEVSIGACRQCECFQSSTGGCTDLTVSVFFCKNQTAFPTIFVADLNRMAMYTFCARSGASSVKHLHLMDAFALQRSGMVEEIQ